MMNIDSKSDYTKSAYGASSDSGSSDERRKSREHENKKAKKSKSCTKKKEGENKDDKWITVTGSGKTKKLLKPKLKPTLHNAFAILSQPDNPTSYNMSGPPLQTDDDKTIIPSDPREHCRQCKIARQQHIKQTLWRLRDSNDLFLDNSITLAEDEWTSLAKANNSNKKRMALNAAHTKRGTTSIGFAQHGRDSTYSLGSAFNRTIKKINKNKHVSFATHNKVHQYINNEQPIMVTYDSGADGHYISEKDRCKASLPILRTSTRNWGCQWRHKQSQIRNPTLIPTTLCSSNAGRHIPGLPYFFDECGQDS